MWKNTDPRHEVDKYASIIVIAGSLLTAAHVETKHGYYVLLNGVPPRGHIEGQCVDADDTWPPTWYWCHLPGE